VVAAVVPVDGVRLEAEEVRAHARQALTPYKVPRRVVFVDELPTNPMGKVLRREVAARLRES
jgi:long-chain acyl-CoA synthetase